MNSYDAIKLILLATVVISYILYKFSIRRFEKVGKLLPGHNRVTILGDFIVLLWNRVKDLNDVLNELENVTEPYAADGHIKAWGGPFFWIVLWDPRLIKELANSPATERKGTLMSRIIRDVHWEGVWSHPGGAEWKVLRNNFNKTMTMELLKNRYHNIILKRNKYFVEYLKESYCDQDIPILQKIYRLNSDIFGETHVGTYTNDVREKKYQYLENLTLYFKKRILTGAKWWFVFIHIVFNLPYPDSPEKKNIRRYIDMIIDEREKILKSHQIPESKGLYTDFLIEKGRAENRSKSLIALQINDITMAGAETSAVAVSSMLVFLAMFPQLQEEVYQEQVAIMGEDLSRDPTPQDLNKMELLTRVVKETLRHVCPLGVMKEAEHDVKLGDYDIPKGTRFLVYTTRLHHDSKYWERPHDFHPDHFLPEQVAARPTYAYIPFGVGPRQCAGIRYAWASMLTGGSCIIRNFKLTTQYKYEDIHYEFGIMRELSPDLYQLSFHERNKQSLVNF